MGSVTGSERRGTLDAAAGNGGNIGRIRSVVGAAPVSTAATQPKQTLEWGTSGSALR